MNLFSRKNIKELLKKYGLRPSKRLGQNFLIDQKTLNKIIMAADLKPEDVVLEIGPGIGTLTQELAKRVKEVVAVEKDRNMVEILKETLKDFDNVQIIQADILKIKNFGIENYKIVANLPFYLTAPAIRKFLESAEARPPHIVLVVQKEVGQRICAKPPHMNLLAVSVQVYAQAKIISYISKKSFWPQPKVDAAIIKIIPQPKLSGSFPDNLLFKVVKAGFSQPRKQLINNLSKGLKMDKDKARVWLQKNNISPCQRAETLSIKDWINLANS